MKYHPNEAKYSVSLKIIAFLFISLLMFTLFGCDDRPQKVQQGMKTYLQDRYGIEFVVGQPYVTGSMDTAHYQAKAHPKGQPEIKFTVDEMSRVNEAGNEYKPEYFRDYYLKEKWNYQGSQAIEKKMREIYGESVDMKITYDFGKGGYAHRDLDFDQLFKQRLNSIISLRIELFIDSTQFNNETEAAKAFAILKTFILDNKSKHYHFDVIFIDKADKKDYLADKDPYSKKTSKKAFPEVRYSDKYEEVINSKRVPGCFRLYSTSEKPLKINSSSDLIIFSMC
jgi:hypothetical protein